MLAIKEKQPDEFARYAKFTISAFSVSIYSSFEGVMAQWKELEGKVPSTIYQTYAWQRAWQDTIGVSEGAEPLLVTASIDEEVVFLLPLTLVKKSGLVAASFMGGDHANYKFALFNPNYNAAINEMLPKLLEEISAHSPSPIDMFDLTRVPLKWDGQENPLAKAFAHHPSSENGGSVSLNGDFDAVLAYGNAKRKRKILRAQERSLEALGGYEFVPTQQEQDSTDYYQLFVEQKQEWFAQRGIPNPFDDDATKAFFKALKQASHDGTVCYLNYSVLRADNQILGILAHSTFKGQNFGYFTSMNLDQKYKAISPGSLTFFKMIEECCTKGLRRFDFGVGGERYKKSWCNEHHDLVDITLPITIKGRLFYAALRLKRHTKQQIKANDTVWLLIKKYRSTLLGSTKKAQ